MTARTIKSKTIPINSITTLLCLAISVILLLCGGEVKKGVTYGIELSINTIIPTLFPFFVLSDLWASYLILSKTSFITILFQKMFGISGNAASSFLCGTICGFPLGAKSAVDLYNSKQIDKKELELLCSISGNPSCAFVISGIGAAMYNDAFIGVLLYFSVIFSACLTGVIFKIKSENMTNSKEIIRQSFSLVNSIQKAGMSSITISSYIIFFSALNYLWCSLCKNLSINLLFSSLFEVSSACCVIKNSQLSPTPLSMSLTAFALGFSGFSVHMQVFSFLPQCVSKGKYLMLKTIIGIFSAIAAFCLFSLLY